MYIRFLRELAEELKFKWNYIRSWSKKYTPEEFLDHFFFYLMEKFPIDHERHKIVIELFHSQGFGDIMNAFKTAKILREKHPNLIISADRDVEYIKEIGEQFGESDRVYPREEVIFGTKKSDEPIVFQIAIPDQRMYIKRSTYVCIDEYNGSRFRTRPMTKKQLAKLEKEKKGCQCEACKKSMNRKLHQSLILMTGGAGLNGHLFPACGFHFLTEKEMDFVCPDWLIEHFVMPSEYWREHRGYSQKVYFAYNSDSDKGLMVDNPNQSTFEHLRRYILTIIKMNESNDNPIRFVLLGVRFTAFKHMGIKEALLGHRMLPRKRRKIKEESTETETETDSDDTVTSEDSDDSFNDEHIARSEGWDYMNDEFKKESIMGLTDEFSFEYEGRKISFVFFDYLPHQVMKYCIKTSEEPVFVTGDQSLIEAVSYDKLFMYQLHGWKTDLLNSFYHMARYLFPPTAESNTRKRLRSGSSKVLDNGFSCYLRQIIGGSASKYNGRMSKRKNDQEVEALVVHLKTHWDEIQRQKEIVYVMMKRHYDIRKALDCVTRRAVHKNTRVHRELKDIMNEMMKKDPDFNDLDRRYQAVIQHVSRGVPTCRS